MKYLISCFCLASLLFSLTAFFGLTVLAQPYGNEWIDYSKTHYKFQSDHNGLMQISYETLLESGIDLTGSAFKLMSGGEEMPIYVTTDGTLSTGDYIEFYATPNDGKYDTQLFEIPEHQLQDKTSLFSKKRTYFLLSDNSTNHLHYENTINDLSSVGDPLPYFWYKSERITNNTYHFGKTFPSATGSYSFSPEFSEGEGWCSGIIKEVINPSTGTNVGQDFKNPTPALYVDGPQDCEVNVSLVSRTGKIGVLGQEIEIAVDNVMYVNDVIESFATNSYEFEIPIESIETSPDFSGIPQTRVNCKAWDSIDANGIESETKFSISKMSITYPRQFDFGNNSFFKFDLEVATNVYIEIANFDGGTNPVLYDLTLQKRIEPVLNGGLYQFNIEVDVAAMRSFVFANVENEESTQMVEELTERNFIDYSLIENQGDYLIVTNDSLRSGSVDEVQRYVNHRASQLGGNYQAQIVEMNQLYDQFAQGINQHPLSIQHFVYFALDHWSIQAKYLNLLGRGVRYDKTRINEENRKASLVPSYGYSPSDWMLVNRGPFGVLNPQLSVGRIPASTPDEVRAYLDKVIEYEALNLGVNCEIVETPEWTKNVLHLVHGWGNTEATDALNGVEAMGSVFEDSPLEMIQMDTLIDITGPVPSGQINAYEEQPEMETYINNGVGIINHFGHGSAFDSWQFDIQAADFYSNEGKYPLIVSIADACANEVYENNSVDRTMLDFINADNGGAIGFLCHQGIFYVSNSSDPSLPFGAEYSINNFVSFLEPFYENLLSDNSHRSIADNIRMTYNSVYGTRDETFDALLKQYVYAGDPAVRLAALQGRDIQLTDANVNSSADEFTVFLDIEFAGESISGPIEIAVERVLPSGTSEGEIISVHIEELVLEEGAQSITFTIPNDPYIAGANQFNISLDPNNQFDERCEYNNEETIVKYLPGVSLVNQYVFAGKVFLEGPYNNMIETNEMNADLGTLVPLTQPYNIPPYNYEGTESLTEIPADLVDWILVEARYGTPNISGNKGTTTVQRQAALLWNDGNITNAQGEPLRFYNLNNNSDFYICIRHRNHLDVLSAQAITSEAYFDFTTNVANAWGESQQKITADGNAALFAADFNSDAVIQVTDFDNWFVLPAAIDVYMPTDANLDGVIQVTDYDLWFLNKAKVGSAEVGF